MALFYLILSFYVGWRVSQPLRALVSSQSSLPSKASTLLFDIPTSWCFGFLFPTSITWLTIQSYAILTSKVPPLLPIAWAVLGFLILCSLWRGFSAKAAPKALWGEEPRANIWPLVGLIWLTTAAVTFGITTVVDGYVQTPQFLIKDFFSHIAIIRSFSQGDNFPTEYPFFAGLPIQYHFLFFFGAAILEELGLSLLMALNVPSWLTLASFLSLVSFLAWKLSGKVLAAYLAPIFCTLRSSLSWTDMAIFHIRSMLSEDAASRKPFAYGITPYEDWGIFAPNVHLNQKHLVFGFCLLLIALCACISTPALQARRHRMAYLSLGALVGIGAYWNGATFIALMVGLPVALLSREHRSKVIITMLVAVVCNVVFTVAVTQGHTTSTPMSLRFSPGFLAPSSSLTDIATYALWILGPLPIVALFGAYLFGTSARLVWLFGLAPIVMIFLFQLTPTPHNGHKFINSAVMVWSTLSAGAVAHMLGPKHAQHRSLVLILVLVLIASGISDMASLVSLGKVTASAPIDTETIKWIGTNTPTTAVFLSASEGDRSIYAAGRRTFQGPSELTKDANYPYHERASVLDQLASEDAETQVRILRELSVNFILKEPCRSLPIRVGNTCVEHESVLKISQNPLLLETYKDSEGKTVILSLPEPAS